MDVQIFFCMIVVGIIYVSCDFRPDLVVLADSRSFICSDFILLIFLPYKGRIFRVTSYKLDMVCSLAAAFSADGFNIGLERTHLSNRWHSFRIEWFLFCLN